jgi:chromosome segregation ATPase
VDNLVSVVERARHKLDELKTRKDEVDSELNDLPVEEAEEIDKEIASLKQDRSDIDDKITALRAQKSDIDDQVNEAKTRRAAVEEKLSHKDDLEHEQSDLAEKIESLESVL